MQFKYSYRRPRLGLIDFILILFVQAVTIYFLRSCSVNQVFLREVFFTCTNTHQKAIWGAVSPYLQQLKLIRKGNMKKRVGYPCFTCDTSHMLLRPA